VIKYCGVKLGMCLFTYVVFINVLIFTKILLKVLGQIAYAPSRSGGDVKIFKKNSTETVCGYNVK